MCSQLACTYPDDGSAATLDAYSNVGITVYCWEGDHLFRGTLSLCFLIYYVLSSSTAGIQFLESAESNDDIRWRESFVLLDSKMRMAFLFPVVTPMMMCIAQVHVWLHEGSLLACVYVYRFSLPITPLSNQPL